MSCPTAYGSAKGGLISGVCKYCGLVKRYPARIRWHRDAGSGHAKDGTPLHVDISHLPEVAPGHSDWDVALDSLVYVHGGSYQTFEFVANQVEGSRLFTDTFIRSLEVHGDLEVERGVRSYTCPLGTESGLPGRTCHWRVHAHRRLEPG